MDWGRPEGGSGHVSCHHKMSDHSELSPFRPQQKRRKCLIIRRFPDNVVNGPTYDVRNPEPSGQRHAYMRPTLDHALDGSVRASQIPPCALVLATAQGL